MIVASGSLFAADFKVVEEIVAKCNGDIVTRSDLDKARVELTEALRREGLTGAALDERVAEESKHLLQDRIDKLLLVQKAKDLISTSIPSWPSAWRPSRSNPELPIPTNFTNG